MKSRFISTSYYIGQIELKVVGWFHFRFKAAKFCSLVELWNSLNLHYFRFVRSMIEFTHLKLLGFVNIGLNFVSRSPKVILFPRL